MSILEDIDEETAEELLAAFEEHYTSVEAAINELTVVQSEELLHQIFRSVHTIKGNAAIVQLMPLVEFTHALEEVISAMRAGTIFANGTICEIILLGMDRIRDLHMQTLRGVQFENLNESEIKESLLSLSKMQSEENIKTAAQKVIGLFTNNFEDEIAISEEDLSILEEENYFKASGAQREDILFFRDLAMQVDRLSAFWEQRSDKQFHWAQKINHIAGGVVDPIQLAAATYLHDVGMAFLPDTIINKTSKLNAMEFKQLQEHSQRGSDIVKRMQGWDLAAEIILQHHERCDGGGYPGGLHDAKISEGAKILAILDAFYAMTNQRADRAHRRSLLRALSEINACSGTQFSSFWVNHFNTMIREEVKQGRL